MKKKMAVLIGMAVCAMLLTSPVLASAGYSKIYGNANEDDVLDMRDVTYIKLAIFGKKPATDFADANYDGKISMLDVGQTKLIILGKEKELTLVDLADRIVTVPRPIERVVALYTEDTRAIVALDGCDILVGIEDSCIRGQEEEKICGGKLTELPDIGFSVKNIELIATLKPDVIFGCIWSGNDINIIQEKTGTTVVCASPGLLSNLEPVYKHLEVVGVVLGREKEAEELISYMEEKISTVTDITSEIPDSEKPTVYLTKHKGVTICPPFYEPIDLAGGIYVGNELPGIAMCQISKEQLIKWNPDIFLIMRQGASSPSWLSVEEVLSDPDLQSINAVKNKKVYYTTAFCRDLPQQRFIPETMYLAKLFHPDKFKDLDLEKEGNEIFKRFYGVDGLYTWLVDETGYLREFIESQK
jgi:iron complex transport system substrate-binding protein